MSNGYNENLGAIRGQYKLNEVLFTSKGIGCEACGHKISNVYVIENIETHEKLNVGSECVKSLLGNKETERILKALKTIESKIKAEYEKPIKNTQLKAYVAENEEVIRYHNEDPKYHNNLYNNVIWRINNNANADETKRDIKYYTDLDCKFTFTKEQKQELKKLQEKTVNEYLQNIKG